MEKHVVQVNVYRLVDGKVSYLLVKRTEADGGFWQPITGTVDEGETFYETIVRELMEEASISKFLNVTDELHSYSWAWKQEGIGTDHVFATLVSPDQQIVLNPNEHTEFRWLSYEDALQLLRWDGNKDSLKIVNSKILNVD